MACSCVLVFPKEETSLFPICSELGLLYGAHLSERFEDLVMTLDSEKVGTEGVGAEGACKRCKNSAHV